MKNILVYICLFFCNTVFGQDVPKQLQEKITALEKDPQFKHAILSMYVVHSKTGKVVFDKNSNYGLAPASCQKVITSASAFELLGKGYRYKTEVYFDKKNSKDFYLLPSGDPTFGSFRYSDTKANVIIKMIASKLKENTKESTVNLQIIKDQWSIQTIPSGWIWEDIGNYYGAGCGKFNWKENQFDLNIQAKISKQGDTAIILSGGLLKEIDFDNTELLTDFNSNEDNAYAYPPIYGKRAYLKGKFPSKKKDFKISATEGNPDRAFGAELYKELADNNITLAPFFTPINKIITEDNKLDLVFTHQSPLLDSLNYWFLKKSINLYGEAFVKTIGYEKKKWGDTDTGLSIIKYFWKQRGIEPSAINIIDGSGLSPANRVTANALVTILQYAKKQNWYSSFYNALPEMNGIKMKDGYISGVRSYTGYIKSKTGNEYTFALMVNNFDGSAAMVREKLWKVLDIMK